MYIDSVLGWSDKVPERMKPIKDLEERAGLLDNFALLKKQFITGAIKGSKQL